MSTTRAMAAVITSGVAIAAGMLVGGSALAHADPDDSAPSSTTPFTSNGAYANIRSIVYWTGPYCIPVRAPGYPEGHHTMITSICGQNSVANYVAYPG